MYICLIQYTQTSIVAVAVARHLRYCYVSLLSDFSALFCAAANRLSRRFLFTLSIVVWSPRNNFDSSENGRIQMNLGNYCVLNWIEEKTNKHFDKQFLQSRRIERTHRPHSKQNRTMSASNKRFSSWNSIIQSTVSEHKRVCRHSSDFVFCFISIRIEWHCCCVSKIQKRKTKLAFALWQRKQFATVLQCENRLFHWSKRKDKQFSAFEAIDAPNRVERSRMVNYIIRATINK